MSDPTPPPTGHQASRRKWANPVPTPLNDRLGRIVRQTAPWSRPSRAPDPVALRAAQLLFPVLRRRGETVYALAVSGTVIEVRDAERGRTVRLTITAEEV